MLRLLEGPLGKHLGDSAPVAGRAVQVGHRLEPDGGLLGCLDEHLRLRRLPAQERLRVAGANRRAAHTDKDEPGVGDHAVVVN